ncbi:hypothetical protein KA005_35470, partial [bacterium]|nr:hypothetical protein [bacterium]
MVLDEFYAQKPIKNAGTAFPSLILYLRNSSAFNLCFKKMEQGLEKLTGFSAAGYSSDSYFNYNNKVNNFKAQYGLQPQEIDIILCIDEVSDHTECPFSSKTFQLLGQLHENPTRDFYQKHREEFKEYLEEPFQQLFYHIASSLMPPISHQMETEKGLFARIIKNDFGKGGAWDFYWGALYPKGGKRISDAQLFMWINRDRLEFGFYIGEYGSDQRNRFIRNCRANHKIIFNILNESLAGSNVQYGEHDEFVGGTKGVDEDRIRPSMQDWLENPEEAGIHAAVFLPKEEALQRSTEQLTQEIVQVYQALFPLTLLAILD